MRGFHCAFLFCLAAACAASAGGNGEIGPAGSTSGARLLVGFEAGPAYATVHGGGLFPLAVRPQMAVWLETTEGRYVSTIFVTHKGGRNSWIGASARPEALPVWRGRRGGPGADAVSAATPSAGMERATALPAGLDPGEYVVLLEVNSSFDYAPAFPESDRRSGDNGQPSLVYAGRIRIGTPGSQTVLLPVGTGSPDGSDGTLHAGWEGLTTALRLIGNPRARYME